MEFLSTAFTRLFLSPFVFALPLAAGAVLVLAGRRRAGAATVLSATAVHLLLSLQPVADLLLRPLEDAYPPPSAAELSGCDAVVVLGGGARKLVPGEEGGSFPTSAPLARLVAGLRARGKGPRTVVVSGGQVGTDPEAETEAAAMRRLLVELGVPGDEVLAETESRNTWENAAFTEELLRQRGARRAVLVTSALHMPRAMRSFLAAGADCVPYGADYLAHRGTYRFLDLLPDFETLSVSFRALHEYVGLLAYGLRRR